MEALPDSDSSVMPYLSSLKTQRPYLIWQRLRTAGWPFHVATSISAARRTSCSPAEGRTWATGGRQLDPEPRVMLIGPSSALGLQDISSTALLTLLISEGTFPR